MVDLVVVLVAGLVVVILKAEGEAVIDPAVMLVARLVEVISN